MIYLSGILELCRVIDGYKLPFDMYNAVLLVRSDLALSSVSFFSFLFFCIAFSKLYVSMNST